MHRKIAFPVDCRVAAGGPVNWPWKTLKIHCRSIPASFSGRAPIILACVCKGHE